MYAIRSYYGFASVLLNILERDRPDYLAVSFDVGRTFRDDMFPDYKGTREKMPDDLSVQIDRIMELVQVFRIPVLTVVTDPAGALHGFINDGDAVLRFAWVVVLV